MSAAMELDQPLGSIQRKRAFSTPSDDEDEDLHLPSVEKRTRPEDGFHTAGMIPARNAIAFHACALLQHLAFTQLYVTANFTNYDPSQSLVLLYVGNQIDEGYLQICDILPEIYTVAPTLQALAMARHVEHLDPNNPDTMSRRRAFPITEFSSTVETLYQALNSGQAGLGGASFAVIVDTHSRCRVVRQLTSKPVDSMTPLRCTSISLRRLLSTACASLQMDAGR